MKDHGSRSVGEFQLVPGLPFLSFTLVTKVDPSCAGPSNWRLPGDSCSST